MNITEYNGEQCKEILVDEVLLACQSASNVLKRCSYRRASPGGDRFDPRGPKLALDAVTVSSLKLLNEIISAFTDKKWYLEIRLNRNVPPVSKETDPRRLSDYTYP